MLQLFACRGAPRDLGFDQGESCRAGVQALASELGLSVRGLGARLRGATAAPQRSELSRHVTRYFPHLSERMAGLAAGARVPRDAVLAAIERAGQPDDPSAGAGGAGFAPSSDGVPTVALGAAGTWVLRTCDADGGYRSLTVTRPAFVGCHGGVNEKGLAGVGWSLAPPRAEERCRAPGLLLLDQCLERFDGVEQALDWCERRLGGGRVRLFFAGADGTRGAVELDGHERRRLDPAECSADPKAPRASLDAAAHALVVTDARGVEQRVTLETPAHSR